MSTSTTIRPGGETPAGARIGLKALVGSGDRIGKVVLPFLVLGVAANVAWPAVFAVGGPSAALATVAWAVLAVGVVIWLWSVALILTKVPKHQLITSGPFALMRHPLYTGVSLLVLPWLGFLLNTWLGLVLGLVIYAASRLYAPAEEEQLAGEFGAEWEAYSDSVMLPWL